MLQMGQLVFPLLSSGDDGAIKPERLRNCQRIRGSQLAPHELIRRLECLHIELDGRTHKIGVSLGFVLELCVMCGGKGERGLHAERLSLVNPSAARAPCLSRRRLLSLQSVSLPLARQLTVCGLRLSESSMQQCHWHTAAHLLRKHAQYGDGECGTLNRICATAQFIQQHKTLRPRSVMDSFHPSDVPRERREVLLERLAVPQIGEDV